MKKIVKVLEFFLACFLIGTSIYCYYIKFTSSDKLNFYFNKVAYGEVVSESMLPELEVGDKLTVVRVKKEDIKPNDICVYYSKKLNKNVVHRVYGILPYNDESLYIFKGDNNLKPDNEMIFYEDILGKVVKNNGKQFMDYFLIFSCFSSIFGLFLLKNSFNNKKEK